MERGMSSFEDEKAKFVFTDISDIAEQKAQDTSLSRFNEKPESDIPSGWKKLVSGKFWKGVGRSIWKQNLARDFLEVKYKKEAEKAIQNSGSIFATEQKFDENEKGISEEEKKKRREQRVMADEGYRQAITSRFAAAEGELVDDLIHSQVGEKIDKLGDGESERQIKSQLQGVVKAFAAGNIDEERLLIEERAIFAAIKGVKPEVIDKGKVYASNLLRVAKWAKEEVARQVAQNIEHNRAVMDLKLDFDVVVGKAKSGVRTQAQFNVVEKAVENIQTKTRGLFGFAFNETFVTSVVSAAYFVKRSLFTRGLSSAAGFVGMVGATGAVAAFREGKVLEKERMQHAREMAQGRTFDESSATRRNELEQFRLKFRTAKDLESDLSDKLFNKLSGGREVKNLSPEEYSEALKSVVEIDSRILESERGIMVRKKKWWQFWRKKEERRGADLIGYSDPTKEAEEEGQLDMARVKAKLELKKWALAHGKTAEQFKLDLNTAIEGNISSFYQGEQGITELNERFSKFKHKKMWQSAKRAMKWGAVLGVAIQEVSAFGDDKAYGAMEHGWDALRQNEHLMATGEHATAIESGIQHGVRYAKEGWEHVFPTVDAESGSNEFFINSAKYHLGGNYDLVPDSSTADPNDYILVDKSGHSLSEGLHFNTDGTPTDDTTQWFKDHGFKVNEHLGTTSSGGIHNLDAAETRNMYPDLATNPRVDWHDEPGKFWSEIHKQWLEFEGKQQMGFLEKIDGKVYLNCSKVIQNFEKEVWERINDPHFGQVEEYTNPDGTPFVDPKMMHLKQQIIEALSKDELNKHFQAAIIPTEGANQIGLSDLLQGADGHGRILLEGKYDWSSMFTDEKMLHDGHLPFKFLEMRFDGHVMATAQGAGEMVQTPPIVEILSPPGDLPPTVFPPLFYVGRRKGLEDTEWSPKNPDIVVPPEYTSLFYGRMSQERIRKYKEKISDRLRENPDIDLDHFQEIEEFFSRMNPERLRATQELAAQAGVLDNETKLSVCIPVAGHQEGDNIYKTLENYLNQTARRNDFEIVLFVNHPDQDKQGNRVTPDKTLEEIERFRKEHPEMKIKVMYKVLPVSEAKIGNIRKYLNEAVLWRHHQRGREVDDLILVSNDADNKGLAPEYIDNYLKKFKSYPQTDAFLGQLDWDPESYVQNPLMHVGTRFFQFVDVQTRRKEIDKIQSSGANFAFRSSIYAAVDGYDPDDGIAEDVVLGAKFKVARDNAVNPNRRAIRFAGARVSRLYTNSRRAMKSLENGLAPIEQWSRGFGAFDEEVRKFQLNASDKPVNFDNPSEVQTFVKALEVVLNRTLAVMVGKDSYWNNTPSGKEVERSLRWIGINYSINPDGTIKISDATKLMENLKDYQKSGLEIMKRKLGREVLGNENVTAFENNPFSFIFGDGLNRVTGSGGGINSFMEGLKNKYGISDQEFEGIREQARRMPNLKGSSRPQKELAQLLRVVMNKNPNLRASWRSSGQAGSYERLVRRLTSSETRRMLTARTLSEQEIERLAQEFGIHPAIIMDVALSTKLPLKQEAGRRFVTVGGSAGGAEIDRLADAQREVLTDYQSGRFILSTRKPRSKKPATRRTT